MEVSRRNLGPFFSTRVDNPAEAREPLPAALGLAHQRPDCSPLCRPREQRYCLGGKWIKCHLRCLHQGQGPGNGLGRKREMQVRERGKVLISGGESKVFYLEEKEERAGRAMMRTIPLPKAPRPLWSSGSLAREGCGL